MNYQIIFLVVTAVIATTALVFRTSAFLKGRPLSRNLFKSFIAAMLEAYVGGLLVSTDRISYASVALGCAAILICCTAFDILALETRRLQQRTKIDVYNN